MTIPFWRTNFRPEYHESTRSCECSWCKCMRFRNLDTTNLARQRSVIRAVQALLTLHGVPSSGDLLEPPPLPRSFGYQPLFDATGTYETSEATSVAMFSWCSPCALLQVRQRTINNTHWAVCLSVGSRVDTFGLVYVKLCANFLDAMANKLQSWDDITRVYLHTSSLIDTELIAFSLRLSWYQTESCVSKRISLPLHVCMQRID
jgi:hypothetical protein